MSETGLAILVFGALCAFALAMFLMERRAVARRKANGTYVDISDILFFGSAATARQKAPDASD